MSATRKKRETDSALYLPYQRHVDENVVALDSGAFMCVMQLDGISFETADNDQINTLHEQLAHRLRDLSRTTAASGLTIWTHLVRRRQPTYVEGDFSSTFAREFNAKYRQKFEGVQAFANELYVTLVYKPGAEVAEKVSGLIRRIKQARSAGSEVDHEAVKIIRDTTRDVLAGLGVYGPRLLGLYERDELVFTEIGEFLSLLVTGEKRPIGLVDGPLGSVLYSDRVIFGGEALEIRGAGDERFGAMLGVNEYPVTTRPGMLDSLLKADFEYVLSQSFRFFDRTTSAGILSRKQNQMVSAKDKAQSQVAALIRAQDDLQSGVFGMGDHHLSLLIYAPSIKALNGNMGAARSFLADAAMIVAREDLGLEAAFWAILPGNFKHRARSAAISTRNFAAFSSFHIHPTGQAAGNHWGPSIMALKTAAGSPLYLNLHVEGLANTFICGPSGSGKTVFQAVLMAMLEKFGAQRVIFDKDRGCEILVRACGGTYLPLANGLPTGCAPLKALDFTPANLQFLTRLLFKLAAPPNGKLTVGEENKIVTALRGLEQVEKGRRSISAVLPMLGMSDPEGVGVRLAKWARGGALGWVLDGDRDELDLRASMLGFDMTDFLDNPEVRTPLMMYLFYRVEQLIDGRRIVIDIDEFWKALQDEAFEDLARNKLKTIRKQNGLMIFGTQSPSDAIQSSISRTIIEQCPTKIYLPNPDASEEDYCGGMNLTQAEFRLLKVELVGTRKFLIKQGNVSVVAELDLAGYGDELAVLSGTTALVEFCGQAREIAGENPDAWLPVFHRLRKEKKA
jgi:type IV secretion system protein VirB4